jgi:hypothetical protein
MMAPKFATSNSSTPIQGYSMLIGYVFNIGYSGTISLIGRRIMAYVTITHWTTADMTDEMIAAANEKYVPMVIQVGASSVQLVRTGELSMCVITQYIDAKIARSAQQRIAHIRSQAASEFPMKITSTLGGEEFGGG